MRHIIRQTVGDWPSLGGLSGAQTEAEQREEQLGSILLSAETERGGSGMGGVG